mgnify:FL=1
MGKYINTGKDRFRSSLRREYVDKSGLIRVINDTLDTDIRFSCVTRCRRFGKSMAANMLAAYYDHSCDSHDLFQNLEIACDPSYQEHLNKYPVIYLDMTAFVTRYKDATVVKQIENALIEDIHKVYPDVPVNENGDLMDLLLNINDATHEQFIFIIDEWDAICREYDPKTKVMDDYLNWLRRMFKSADGLTVFAAVYITGILPIKKYNTESALNNFKEYSMVVPGKLSCYFGFTKDEVRVLAQKHDMDFNELEKWYDGYRIGNVPSIFNPNSVMTALDNGVCQSYWSATGAYDAVAKYISMNYEGLKDYILKLLGGGKVKVKTTTFDNDLSLIGSRDDVLTVLIHLGYLSFDWRTNECYVPNLEVSGVLSNAVEKTNWKNVAKALQDSEELLEATINGEEETVAQAIDTAYDEHTSILSYNNENSLACVISIAYFSARNDYKILREMPSGKGFADLVFTPRKNVDKPALVIELKMDQSAETAITQIKRKNYPASVADYAGILLLVGINYDKKTKQHTCMIEKY